MVTYRRETRKSIKDLLRFVLKGRYLDAYHVARRTGHETLCGDCLLAEQERQSNARTY